MEHEIVWGGEPEDVRLTASGTATVEEIEACTREVFYDPRYRPGLRLLVDHRFVDWSRMTEDDVRRTVELLVGNADHIGSVYCAMVMGRPVDYGIARMRQHYVEAQPELQVELRVFISIEDARLWLATRPVTN